MSKGKTLEEMRRKYLPPERDENGGATQVEAPPKPQLKVEEDESLRAILDAMGACVTDQDERVHRRSAPDLSSMRSAPSSSTRRARFVRVPSRAAGEPDDALLQFGRYQGHEVSSLATDREGRSYLEWMLRENFPPDLCDIVRAWLSIGMGW